MKNRIGFVSNSSSCSFILNPRWDLNVVKEKLRMLVDFYNKFNSIDIKLEYMFMEPFISDGNNFELNDIAGNSEDWDIQTRPGEIVIVSKSDNTVPYEIISWIEFGMDARRYHLG